MATIKAKIESYIGSLDATETTSAADFVLFAARNILSALPAGLFIKEAVPTEVTGDGLSLANSRLISVQGKNGYLCKEVPAADRLRYTSSTSLFKATDDDPVFWQSDSKIYIQGTTAISGATNAGYAYIIAYPTSVALGTDTTLTGVPSKFERLVLLDASIQILSYRANEKIKTTLSAQTYANITAPSAPSTLDLSTQYDELDTDLDTEEDVELAMAKISEIKSRIEAQSQLYQKYQVDAALYSSKITGYNADLGKVLNEYQAIVGQIGTLRLMYKQELATILGQPIQQDKEAK